MNVEGEIPAGYKRTEAGVIPQDWAVQSLCDRCEKIQDGTHFSPRVTGGSYPYVTSKNIGSGTLDIRDAPTIDELQHRAIYRRCDTRFGDLLLTKDGASTGNAALNNLHQEISLLSSVAMLRFDDTRDVPAYYLQQVLSQPMQARIKGAMSGNAITRLTLTKIKRLQVAVCGRDEQRAIADVLGDVDALLDALDRQIAKQRDLKHAAMQQLLTGRTRLPGFIGEWQELALGDVANFSKGFGLPKSALEAGGTQPCIHYGELFTQYDVSIGETISRTNAVATAVRSITNDVLMPTSDVTPRGLAKASCVLVDGIVLGGDILIIRADRDRVDGTFLSCLIRYDADQVLRLVTGSTVYHLYATDMRKFQLRLPPIAEQTAIAAVLSDMDAEITALAARRAKTRDLKQAMLQELLTGRTRLV